MSRHLKLFKLNSEEIKSLREKGVNVPFNDFNFNNMDYNILLKTWSYHKKRSFLKTLMNEFGIQIFKTDNEFSFKVNESIEEDVMLKTLNYLAIENVQLMEIRKPEEVVTQEVNQQIAEKVSN